jgi:hypothetical protein
LEEVMVAGAEKSSKGLPTAQEMMEKLALAEAKKAEEASRKHATAEAEKNSCSTSSPNRPGSPTKRR